MRLEFHHINYVSDDVEALNDFYVNILKMTSIPTHNFIRTTATQNSGYDGKIKFTTEGNIQMHLAERDLNVATKNGQLVNPIEKGHIAFRTDDIEQFKNHLHRNGINYSDYGTTFSAEWHQIFFCDPEGNIIEVHEKVSRA